MGGGTDLPIAPVLQGGLLDLDVRRLSCTKARRLARISKDKPLAALPLETRGETGPKVIHEEDTPLPACTTSNLFADQCSTSLKNDSPDLMFPPDREKVWEHEGRGTFKSESPCNLLKSQGMTDVRMEEGGEKATASELPISEPSEQITAAGAAPADQTSASKHGVVVSTDKLERPASQHCASDTPVTTERTEDVLIKAVQRARLQLTASSNTNELPAILQLLLSLESAAGLKRGGIASLIRADQEGDRSEVEAAIQVPPVVQSICNALRKPLTLHMRMTAKEESRKKLIFIAGVVAAGVGLTAGGAALAASYAAASAYSAAAAAIWPWSASAAAAAAEAAAASAAGWGTAALGGFGGTITAAVALDRLVKEGTWKEYKDILLQLRNALPQLTSQESPLQGQAANQPNQPSDLGCQIGAQWDELGIEAGAKLEDVLQLPALEELRSKLDNASALGVLRRARMVYLVSRICRLLRDTCFVGVVGAENAGKSTLIQGMATCLGKGLKVPAVGPRVHTHSVGGYQVEDTLWMVDFPGYNGLVQNAATAWKRFTLLPSFCIFVLQFEGDVNSDIVTRYRDLKESFQGTEIAILVNKVDRCFEDATLDLQDVAACKKDFCRALDCKEEDVFFTVLKRDRFRDEFLEEGVLGIVEITDTIKLKAARIRHVEEGIL